MTKFAIVRSETLTLFIETLTTDDKYSRRNMLNFAKQFEAPLSNKQAAVSAFFIAFLKCALNLERLGKKDEYPSLVFYKIKDSERGGYLSV